MSTRFWFSKQNVLCVKDESLTDGYYVVNGDWRFYIKRGNAYFDDGQLMYENITPPVEVTREEFSKIQPDFGYW